MTADASCEVINKHFSPMNIDKAAKSAVTPRVATLDAPPGHFRSKSGPQLVGVEK